MTGYDEESRKAAIEIQKFRLKKLAEIKRKADAEEKDIYLRYPELVRPGHPK